MSPEVLDNVIGLFAGRDAKLRLERKRTLKLFQSLPSSPIQQSDRDVDEQTWADDIGGRFTGLRASRRSFLRPWEEPNFGIQFRYREARDYSGSTYCRSPVTSRTFSQSPNTSVSSASSIGTLEPLGSTIDPFQGQSSPSREQSSANTSPSKPHGDTCRQPSNISTELDSPSPSPGSTPSAYENCPDTDTECPLEAVETLMLDPELDISSGTVEISSQVKEPGIKRPQLTKVVTFAELPKVFNLPPSSKTEFSVENEDDLLFITSPHRLYSSTSHEHCGAPPDIFRKQSNANVGHAIPFLDFAERQLNCAFPPEVLPLTILPRTHRPVLNLTEACAEGGRIDLERAATAQRLAKEKQLIEQQARMRLEKEGERLVFIPPHKRPLPLTPIGEHVAANCLTEKWDVKYWSATSSGPREADPQVKRLTTEQLASCPRPNMLEIKSKLSSLEIRQLEAKVAVDLQKASLFRQPALPTQFRRAQINIGPDPGPWSPVEYLETPKTKSANMRTEKKMLIAKGSTLVARARYTKRTSLRNNTKSSIGSRRKCGEGSIRNGTEDEEENPAVAGDEQEEDEWDPTWMVEATPQPVDNYTLMNNILD